MKNYSITSHLVGFLIVSSIVVLLLIISFGQQQRRVVEQGGRKQNILAETLRYRLSFSGFTSCSECPDGVELALRVEDKSRNQTHNVTLQGFREVAPQELKTSIVGNRAVIVGEQTHGDQVVVLKLDLLPAVEKSLYCFAPYVSNDGTKVVYSSPMLRYTPETNTTVLSILDASDSALKSYVVYPAENAGAQDPKPFVDNVADRRILISPISWREDDMELVFFERIGDRNEFYLVVIDLNAGLAAPLSYREKVDVNSLIKKDAPDIPERLVFQIEKITWIDNRTIEAYVHHEYYWKQDSIRLTLPAGGGN